MEITGNGCWVFGVGIGISYCDIYWWSMIWKRAAGGEKAKTCFHFIKFDLVICGGVCSLFFYSWGPQLIRFAAHWKWFGTVLTQFEPPSKQFTLEVLSNILKTIYFKLFCFYQNVNCDFEQTSYQTCQSSLEINAKNKLQAPTTKSAPDSPEPNPIKVVCSRALLMALIMDYCVDLPGESLFSRLFFPQRPSYHLESPLPPALKDQKLAQNDKINWL